MRDKTKTRLLNMRSGETETEKRLDCKIILRPRPRLLINFQRKRDRDLTWFRISHETKTRPRVSYTSVSRPRRDRDSRQSVFLLHRRMQLGPNHVCVILITRPIIMAVCEQLSRWDIPRLFCPPPLSERASPVLNRVNINCRLQFLLKTFKFPQLQNCIILYDPASLYMVVYGVRYPVRAGIKQQPVWASLAPTVSGWFTGGISWWGTAEMNTA